MRRDASWSLPTEPTVEPDEPDEPPGDDSTPSRDPNTASISSRKTVLGAWCLARVNKVRTNFSLSPRHFETTLLALMLKKKVSVSYGQSVGGMW
jgi:hypothetical protein